MRPRSSRIEEVEDRDPYLDEIPAFLLVPPPASSRKLPDKTWPSSFYLDAIDKDVRHNKLPGPYFSPSESYKKASDGWSSDSDVDVADVASILGLIMLLEEGESQVDGLFRLYKDEIITLQNAGISLEYIMHGGEQDVTTWHYIFKHKLTEGVVALVRDEERGGDISLEKLMELGRDNISSLEAVLKQWRGVIKLLNAEPPVLLDELVDLGNHSVYALTRVLLHADVIETLLYRAGSGLATPFQEIVQLAKYKVDILEYLLNRCDKVIILMEIDNAITLTDIMAFHEISRPVLNEVLNGHQVVRSLMDSDPSVNLTALMEVAKQDKYKCVDIIKHFSLEGRNKDISYKQFIGLYNSKSLREITFMCEDGSEFFRCNDQQVYNFIMTDMGRRAPSPYEIHCSKLNLYIDHTRGYLLAKILFSDEVGVLATARGGALAPSIDRIIEMYHAHPNVLGAILFYRDEVVELMENNPPVPFEDIVCMGISNLGMLINALHNIDQTIILLNKGCSISKIIDVYAEYGPEFYRCNDIHREEFTVDQLTKPVVRPRILRDVIKTDPINTRWERCYGVPLVPEAAATAVDHSASTILAQKKERGINFDQVVYGRYYDKGEGIGIHFQLESKLGEKLDKVKGIALEDGSYIMDYASYVAALQKKRADSGVQREL